MVRGEPIYQIMPYAVLRIFSCVQADQIAKQGRLDARRAINLLKNAAWKLDKGGWALLAATLELIIREDMGDEVRTLTCGY